MMNSCRFPIRGPGAKGKKCSAVTKAKAAATSALSPTRGITHTCSRSGELLTYLVSYCKESNVRDCTDGNGIIISL